MMKTLRHNYITKITEFSPVLEVCCKGMKGGLRVIPMITLSCILENKGISSEKSTVTSIVLGASFAMKECGCMSSTKDIGRAMICGKFTPSNSILCFGVQYTHIQGVSVVAVQQI